MDLEHPTEVTFGDSFEGRLSLLINCAEGVCWPCLRIRAGDINIEVVLTAQEAERLADCLYKTADYANMGMPHGHGEPPEEFPYETDFLDIPKSNYSK